MASKLSRLLFNFGTFLANWPTLTFLYSKVLQPYPNFFQYTLYFGSVEDILHTEHGDDGEDLVTAGQVHGHDKHLGQHGLQGELRHLCRKKDALI